MTNDEILEAEKLSAGMRTDLQYFLARTANVEKLTALVLEAVPRLYDSFYQLVRHRPTIFESVSDYDTVNNGLAAMLSVAQMAERHPDWKAKLIDTVKKNVSLVHSVLLKTERALLDLWVNAPITNEEILEAEKLIALIRNDLAVIVGEAQKAMARIKTEHIADVEKLTSLVEGKVLRIMHSFYQLVRHRPTIFGSPSDYSLSVEMPLTNLIGTAFASRRGYKLKLLNAVERYVPIVDSTMEQIVQALKGNGSMPTLPDEMPPAPEMVLRPITKTAPPREG